MVVRQHCEYTLRMKKYLAVVLCVLISNSCWARTSHRNFAEVITEAEEGIAAVVVPGSLPGVGIAVGMAFFVSDEYLLTAAHVIRAAEKEPAMALYVPRFVPNTKRIGGSDSLQFEVTAIDNNFDIAVLHVKTKNRNKVHPFAIALGSLAPGTEVA